MLPVLLFHVEVPNVNLTIVVLKSVQHQPVAQKDTRVSPTQASFRFKKKNGSNQLPTWVQLEYFKRFEVKIVTNGETFEKVSSC